MSSTNKSFLFKKNARIFLKEKAENDDVRIEKINEKISENKQRIATAPI